MGNRNFIAVTKSLMSQFIAMIFMSLAAGSVAFSANDELPQASMLPEQTEKSDLKNQANGVGETPQSDPNWRYPHNPMKVRLGFFIGDQAGGPIRFNTRFPELKSDPHPASYFHSLPLVGGELEYGMKGGGFLLGALVRRDLWHPGIEKRELAVSGQTWMVDDFAVNSTAFIFGWVFGERYREAPWNADIAFVYDRGSADTTLSDSLGDLSIGQVSIDALSFRARLQFNLYGVGAVSISAGPDFHVPVWQSVTDQSDDKIAEWLATNMELKSSAALGVSMMTSYRF